MIYWKKKAITKDQEIAREIENAQCSLAKLKQ